MSKLYEKILSDLSKKIKKGVDYGGSLKSYYLGDERTRHFESMVLKLQMREDFKTHAAKMEKFAERQALAAERTADAIEAMNPVVVKPSVQDFPGRKKNG